MLSLFLWLNNIIYTLYCILLPLLSLCNLNNNSYSAVNEKFIFKQYMYINVFKVNYLFNFAIKCLSWLKIPTSNFFVNRNHLFLIKEYILFQFHQYSCVLYCNASLVSILIMSHIPYIFYYFINHYIYLLLEICWLKIFFMFPIS